MLSQANPKDSLEFDRPLPDTSYKNESVLRQSLDLMPGSQVQV